MLPAGAEKSKPRGKFPCSTDSCEKKKGAIQVESLPLVAARPVGGKPDYAALMY
jgi:hypothetical protein